MGREATGAEARCPEIRLDRTVHPVIPSDCPTWAWRGLAWVQSPAWGMRFHDFFIFFSWYSVGGEEISADPKSLLLPGLRASL